MKTIYLSKRYLMGKTEKKINKWIIGAIIGSALIGAGGLSMTPKGKSWWRRLFRKSKKRTNFFVTRAQKLGTQLQQSSKKKKVRK